MKANSQKQRCLALRYLLPIVNVIVRCKSVA